MVREVLADRPRQRKLPGTIPAVRAGEVNKMSTKTITANIPARTIKWAGKSQTYAAHSVTLTQDDAGQWHHPEGGKITEADAIEICEKASNWSEIKATHFRMHGFHS